MEQATINISLSASADSALGIDGKQRLSNSIPQAIASRNTDLKDIEVVVTFKVDSHLQGNMVKATIDFRLYNDTVLVTFTERQFINAVQSEFGLAFTNASVNVSIGKVDRMK